MTEWEDQQRAVRDERIGAGSAGTEPRIAQYRLIARVLREPVQDGLPPDFAAMVAARAETSAHEAADRRDLWLERAAFAGLAATATVMFGGDLLSMLRQLIVDVGADGAAARQWSMAIGVCLTLTLSIDVWRATR